MKEKTRCSSQVEKLLSCNFSWMSTSSRTDSDASTLDVEEILHIGSRCRVLKEKDMLKESQSQSHNFDRIKRLELHVKEVTEARSEDRKQIQGLERELSSCYEEIEYLRDQLNSRNTEMNCLSDHAHYLEIKLADMDNLEQEVVCLREQLKRSRMECLFLRQELESKEKELQKLTIFLDKLEESNSSAALEAQCEIETLRLEMLAVEQSCFEVKKSEEESFQDKARMTELMHELEIQMEVAQESIKRLEKENKELKCMLQSSDTNTKLFCQRVEEHFKGWLDHLESVRADSDSDSNEWNDKPTTSKEVSMCGEVLGPLLLKLLGLGTSDAELEGSIEKMSHQILQYKGVIKRLREELKEEKLRSKDEAEDLAQEMAELRYQMTCMLDEERKRRACIEQASLRRIAELETQVQIERRKNVTSIGNMPGS